MLALIDPLLTLSRSSMRCPTALRSACAMELEGISRSATQTLGRPPVVEPVLPVAQRLAILHVWSYGESVGDLLNPVQKLSSPKDIASRLG